MSTSSVRALTSKSGILSAGPESPLYGVYKSTDSGANWTLSAPPGTSVLSFLVNGNNMFAGTQTGGVYKSIDNGLNWTYSGPLNVTVDALAGNVNTIFAGIGLNGVNKSTDNGISWSQTSLGNRWVYALAARNNDIIAGTTNGIYTSTDNGLTWTQTLQSQIVNALILAGNNEDFYAGTLYGVWKSTNYGANWVQTSLGNQVIHSFAVSGNTIIAGVNTNGVFVSQDGGISWTQRREGFVGNTTIHSLCIFNNYIFAGRGTSGVWKRLLGELTSSTFQSQFNRNNLNKPITDNGNTHDTLRIGYKSSTIYSVLDVNLQIDTVIHSNDSDLEFYLIHNGITDTVIYQAGGSGDNFIGTLLNDSAATFISNGTSPFTGSYRPHKPLSQFDNGDVNGDWILKIYDRATGNTGTLQAWSLIFTILINPIGIEPIGQEIPTGYALSQNYPNPFNPTTKIRFQIPKSGFVNVRVYDVLGRELTTLVNEQLQPGTYEADWDGSNYPSGVYYYKLNAGSFSETRKMILLK